MPMRDKGRVTHKTLQGKLVDMDLLRQKNELTPAVGNMRVNARGDELGPGGKIVRKREEILKDYYNSAKGVPDEQLVTSKPSVKVEDTTHAKSSKKKTTKVQEDWVEDTNGNFVPKDS